MMDLLRSSSRELEPRKAQTEMKAPSSKLQHGVEILLVLLLVRRVGSERRAEQLQTSAVSEVKCPVIAL